MSKENDENRYNRCRICKRITFEPDDFRQQDPCYGYAGLGKIVIHYPKHLRYSADVFRTCAECTELVMRLMGELKESDHTQRYYRLESLRRRELHVKN